MTLDGIPTFTVQFGKFARTIVYTDSAGSRVFTFDLSGKEPGAPLVSSETATWPAIHSRKAGIRHWQKRVATRL